METGRLNWHRLPIWSEFLDRPVRPKKLQISHFLAFLWLKILVFWTLFLKNFDFLSIFNFFKNLLSICRIHVLNNGLSNSWKI